MTTKEREIAAKKVEGYEAELSPELLKAYKKEHDLEDETTGQKVNDKPAPSKATPLTESGVNDKETVKKEVFEDRLLKGLPVELKVSLSILSNPPDVPIERKLIMVHGIIERIRDTGSLAVGVNGVIEGVEDFGEIEEKWQAALQKEKEIVMQKEAELNVALKKGKRLAEQNKEAEQDARKIEEEARLALEEEKAKTKSAESAEEGARLSIKTMEKVNSDLAKLNVQLRKDNEKLINIIKDSKKKRKIPRD